MASDDLPNEFDIIVVGTGLTETIVAAAFSRIGLKVLHLDRNDYYGGTYANFNLQAIETWKQRNESLVEKTSTLPESGDLTDIQPLLKEGEKAVVVPLEPPCALNIKTQFYIRERTAEEEVVAEAKKSKARFKMSPPMFLHDLDELDQVENHSDSKANEDAQKSDLENTAKKENVDEDLEKTSEENVQVKVTKNKQELRDTAVTDETDNLSELKLTESHDRDEELVKNLSGAAGDSHSVLTSKIGEDAEAEIAEQSGSQQSQEWTVGDIKDEWRRYCFDISPKVLYSCGEIVELLIQSDVARYCEFRTVSRVLTLLNDNLQQVPCSRADVFSSKIVSLIEKRLMMKFLQFAADYENNPEEYKEYKEKPFVDFLKSKRLTPNIHHFVQHAIAMVTDTATTEEGLKSTQVFLRSLGRYGNTAFLFPLYGTGELPQAFARLCAVFGGIYCLQMSLTHIVTDTDNKCCGIIASNGQLIRCKYLIAETSYLPSSYVLTLSSRTTSRAVYITDNSVLPSAESELSLLNFAGKEDPTRPVVVLELPSTACVCPQNLFIVHLTRVAADSNAEEDFIEVKETLFSCDSSDDKGSKPKILWSAYFNVEDKSQVTTSDTASTNVLVVSAGGDAGVDLDFCVQEAKCIFNTVCPDEEFLPKPPNPEDIIHVDDTETSVATGPSEYEAKDIEERSGEKANDCKKDDETKTNDSEDAGVEQKNVENKDVSSVENPVDGLLDSVEKFNIETGEV